jgi:hypothetical protein
MYENIILCQLPWAQGLHYPMAGSYSNQYKYHLIQGCVSRIILINIKTLHPSQNNSFGYDYCCSLGMKMPEFYTFEDMQPLFTGKAHY